MPLFVTVPPSKLAAVVKSPVFVTVMSLAIAELVVFVTAPEIVVFPVPVMEF